MKKIKTLIISIIILILIIGIVLLIINKKSVDFKKNLLNKNISDYLISLIDKREKFTEKHIKNFKIIGPKTKYPISKYVASNIFDKCFLILRTAFSRSSHIFPHPSKQIIIFFLWVNKIRILL